MAHDPYFEQRIADALKAEGVIPEHKKMFGGVAFMVHGNMCMGITNKGDLMVRFDGGRHAEVRKWPGAKPMTFGKGDMKGFLFVDASSVGTATALRKWLSLSLEYVRGLPRKTTKLGKARKGQVPAGRLSAINKSAGKKSARRG